MLYKCVSITVRAVKRGRGSAGQFTGEAGWATSCDGPPLHCKSLKSLARRAELVSTCCFDIVSRKTDTLGLGFWGLQPVTRPVRHSHRTSPAPNPMASDSSCDSGSASMASAPWSLGSTAILAVASSGIPTKHVARHSPGLPDLNDALKRQPAFRGFAEFAMPVLLHG